jgi:hypothetical protein
VLGPPSKRTMKACSVDRIEAAVQKQLSPAAAGAQLVGDVAVGAAVAWFERTESDWFAFRLYEYKSAIGQDKGRQDETLPPNIQDRVDDDQDRSDSGANMVPLKYEVSVRCPFVEYGV